MKSYSEATTRIAFDAKQQTPSGVLHVTCFETMKMVLLLWLEKSVQDKINEQVKIIIRGFNI